MAGDGGECSGVMLRPAYSQEMHMSFQLNMGLGGPKKGSGRVGDEKYFFSSARNRTTILRTTIP